MARTVDFEGVGRDQAGACPRRQLADRRSRWRCSSCPRRDQRNSCAPAAKPGEFPPPGSWTIVSVLVVADRASSASSRSIRLAMGSRLTVGEAIGHGVRRAAGLSRGEPDLAAALIALFRHSCSRSGCAADIHRPATALALLVLLPILIFFAVRLIMSSSVASAETVGPLGILRRSWQLTRGHWWRLFAFFLLFLIAAAGCDRGRRSDGRHLRQLVFGSSIR